MRPRCTFLYFNFNLHAFLNLRNKLLPVVLFFTNNNSAFVNKTILRRNCKVFSQNFSRKILKFLEIDFFQFKWGVFGFLLIDPVFCLFVWAQEIQWWVVFLFGFWPNHQDRVCIRPSGGQYLGIRRPTMTLGASERLIFVMAVISNCLKTG